MRILRTFEQYIRLTRNIIKIDYHLLVTVFSHEIAGGRKEFAIGRKEILCVIMTLSLT